MSMVNMFISTGVYSEVQEFKTLALIDTGEAYEWSAEAVLRRIPDGALFYVSDSGCSCNSFGDSLTVADLKPIFTIHDAYKLSSDRTRLRRSYETQEEIYA